MMGANNISLYMQFGWQFMNSNVQWYLLYTLRHIECGIYIGMFLMSVTVAFIALMIFLTHFDETVLPSLKFEIESNICYCGMLIIFISKVWQD